MELINGTAVAIIRRFDRTDDGGCIPYVSAATMLQSDGRDAVHAYTELVDVLLQEGADPIADVHQLWRRYFRLDAEEAAAICTEVARTVDSWRVVAKRLGMQGIDLVDFEPVFA